MYFLELPLWRCSKIGAWCVCLWLWFRIGRQWTE